ncbi:3301_t:CDS:2 [Acaulospora colombiana]|uniref:3301_t:CDS:1 n=1 Tax=Acaulospora colombiana TaxID=27376 RepID=A0ACA9LK73_9GLOM|nr:3301_t:CDS:2 [Acaulospora colombiana]
MLYHDFEKQQKLVRDHSCPRTQLHQRLLEYTSEVTGCIQSSLTNPQPFVPYHFPHSSLADKTQWILFQVRIFDDEILKHDISTVTTAFNSPNQYIFINVSLKSDFAEIVANTIVTKKAQPNRNYVVGEFVSLTFLGHIYRVINHGLEYNSKILCEITEFETTNQLRISGLISARPIPRILYPNCDSYVYKLGIEVSFQYGAIIYNMLNHRRVTLRDWVLQKIEERNLNRFVRIRYDG